jgi:hypothetical protein
MRPDQREMMLPVGLKPPSKSAVSFSVTGGPSVTLVEPGVVLSVGSFTAIGYPSSQLSLFFYLVVAARSGEGLFTN